jgi:hypothetical protein
MSEEARKPRFTPDSFGAAYPHDQLLEMAARLTLRLSQRCYWVGGCTDKDDDDPDSWNGLYERISDLMGAYVHTSQQKFWPFALALRVIASVPSLQAAVAADLAAKPDNDS